MRTSVLGRAPPGYHAVAIEQRRAGEPNQRQPAPPAFIDLGGGGKTTEGSGGLAGKVAEQESGPVFTEKRQLPAVSVNQITFGLGVSRLASFVRSFVNVTERKSS